MYTLPVPHKTVARRSGHSFWFIIVSNVSVLHIIALPLIRYDGQALLDVCASIGTDFFFGLPEYEL